jgi:hypothetical protein
MALEGDSRNPITYLLYDLMTGNLLAEMPFTSVTLSQRLNVPGQFQGSLNFLDTRIRNLMPGQVILPGRTALFVDYLGSLIWGGIIWTKNFARSTAGGVPIAGKEFWSYFVNRVQAADYTNPTWTNFAGYADPMVIAAQVISDAVASTGSALGPTTGFPLTINQNNGIGTPGEYWIVQSYPYTQLQTVDTIIGDLASMGYNVGFDYGIDVAYNSLGVPTLALNMSYPRRGRIASVSSVTVVTESSSDYTYPEDATQMATSIYATGAASGQNAIVSNPGPITAGWPLLELVNSYTNISVLTTLTEVAQGDLNTQSWPITTPQVTIPMFGDPAPFEYLIGDDIRWIIEPDERFPNGLDYYWRIAGIDWKVADEGQSTAMLTLNIPPGTGAPEPPT